MEAIPCTRTLAILAAATLLTLPAVTGTILLDDGTLGTSGACDDVDGPEQGCIEWAARSTLRGINDVGKQVIVAPDGSQVYVLAQAQAPEGSQALVYALDPVTGEQARQPAISLDGHIAGSLAFAADGQTLYLATRTTEGAGHLFTWVPSDPAGPSLLTDESLVGVHTLLPAPSLDAVCAVGTDAAAEFAGDARVACFATDTGDPVVEATVGTPGGMGLDAALDEDGETLFLTAMTGGAGAFPTASVHALDLTTGDELWSHEREALEIVLGLALGPDGTGVYVTGWTMGPGAFSDAATHRLDAATGELVWTGHHDVARDLGIQVVVDPAGQRVFTAGMAEDSVLTMAHDAETGEKLWADARESGWSTSGWETGRALALSPDGSMAYTVATIPRSDALGGLDYGVIGYDAATGQERWYNVYDGPGGDFDVAWDGAIAPDGSQLFVTGQSFDSFGADDRVLTGGPATWFPQDSPKNSMATVAFDLEAPIVEDVVDEVRGTVP